MCYPASPIARRSGRSDLRTHTLSLIADFRIEQVDEAKHPRLADVATNEYNARAAIIRWPLLEPCRGMVYVLNPMNERRAVGFFQDRDNAFHAQQVGAAIFGQRRQQKRECYAVQWLLPHD